MSEATARVVVGKITGVEPKGDWLQVSVTEEGNQWPVKASTKKDDIKKAALELLASGAIVTAQIGEKESTKINPNNQKPYIDRYLNAIAITSPGDVSSSQASPAQTAPGAQPQAQTGNGYIDAQTKELHIMRQNAMGHAVTMLSLAVQSGEIESDAMTTTALVETAEAIVAYYVYGAARFGVAAFDTGVFADKQEHLENQDQQQSLPDGAPAHDDDDIPF